MRSTLLDVFNQLDQDGSQSIGLDELEDALVAVGLVDSREQVESMLAQIDNDGEIEFEEFITLIKGGRKMGIQKIQDDMKG